MFVPRVLVTVEAAECLIVRGGTVRYLQEAFVEDRR